MLDDFGANIAKKYSKSSATAGLFVFVFTNQFVCDIMNIIAYFWRGF